MTPDPARHATQDTPASTEPQIRVGVVGAGGMSQAHLSAWQRLGIPARVYSVSGRALDIAPEFEAQGVRTLAELVAGATVVDICTPTDTHPALALDAIAAGRHVICEKPLALTHDAARDIITAAAGAGVGLYVAHVLRYFAAYATAQQAVADGSIGTPMALKLSRTGPSPEGSWFHDETRSGGVLMDQMIHDFDYARWIAGEVVSVTARTSPGRGNTVTASATLQHASGATSQLTGGWLEPDAPFSTSFSLTGTAGELRHTNMDDALVLACHHQPDMTLWSPGGGASGQADQPFDAQFGEFVAAITGGPAPRITPADALAAIDLTLAARRAAHTGAAQTLPDSSAGG